MFIKFNSKELLEALTEYAVNHQLVPPDKECFIGYQGYNIVMGMGIGDTTAEAQKACYNGMPEKRRAILY